QEPLQPAGVDRGQVPRASSSVVPAVINLDQVPTFAPHSAPTIGDQRLSAGVRLAQRLLLIISASILVLVLYLFVMDWRNTGSADSVAERVLSFAQHQSIRPDPRKLDSV